MADYDYNADDVDADEEGLERVRCYRSDGDSDQSWIVPLRLIPTQNPDHTYKYNAGVYPNQRQRCFPHRRAALHV